MVDNNISEPKKAKRAPRRVHSSPEASVAYRKRAEDAVETERKRLGNVLDMLPAYLILLSPDYHVRFANRFFEERFGKSHGQRCYEYLFQRAEPCEVCETFRALQTRSRVEWEWLGPDGRNYYIYDFPFTDTDGSILIMEVGLDITERKIAEKEINAMNAGLEQRVAERTADMLKANEALQHSETRYRTLVESSPDGVLSIDASGCINTCNEWVCQFLGQPRETIIGRPALQILTDVKPTELSSFIAELVKKGQVEGEFIAMNSHGQTVPLWVKAVNLSRRQGRPTQTIVYARDIAERKKLDQIRDEFISLVSHELRTPMTIIIGSLSTILSEEERLSKAETHQLLEDAVAESEALSRLLENLLELSRIQAQQLSLYHEPVEIGILIKNVVKKVKRLSAGHQVLVSVPDDISTVNADPLRVERILYNLLENAVKYSPEKSRVRVSVAQKSGYLVVGVSDQGKGLSPLEQAKLFQPFQRLDHAIAAGVKGVGLGLVVCQRLAEAHGGRVWVESKLGRGSTFYFSLPLKSAA
jgi:PAS domain S-box-containing protein